MPKHTFGRSLASLALWTLLGAHGAAAQLPVFSGDPIDGSTGDPYTVLPGVGLILPGDDEKYETGDDVVNGSIVGDVDVVVRTGGGYAGGALPPPSAGIAAAPALTAGGMNSGIGTEVAFQAILSDGATSPPLGNPLLGTQHDARGVIVLVYPDLDGDGVIGPHAADGNADNEVERQEVFTIIGRQLSAIESGVGSGSIGVGLGAPAAHGGLGAVVAAGVLMGSTGPEYFDGPWVSTLLPIMPPTDPERLIGGGGGVRAPEAGQEYLVEIELEYERWFSPAPGHPVLGTPYAIPTDGSSGTVDLLRCNSGPASSASLGIPVVPGSFVADPTRRLLPGVGSGGSRLLIEAVGALGLPDDGPGNTQTVYVFAADLLGNPAGLSSPMTVVVESGPTMNIVAPDTDADLHRESIVLTSAQAASITIDDAGGNGDGSPSERLIATVGGVPTASLRVFDGGAIACGNGVLEAGEACDDGNLQDGDGCQADCTLPPQHDAVVYAPRPLKVKIADGQAATTKQVRVKVGNGSLGGSNDEIKLVAADGTCPAGTVAGLPDFGDNSAGPPDSATLSGGASATAKVPLSLSSAAFTSLNEKTPARCRIELSVTSVVPGGNIDTMPANNVAGIEIDVYDLNDAPQAAPHESYLASIKPMSIRLGDGKTQKIKRLAVAVANGDVEPEREQPGHAITVSVDPGDCPVGAIGAPDFDPDTIGSQTTMIVGGGSRARAQVSLAIDASAFDTANAKSPARCSGAVTVSGPGGDTDSSNDTTRLIVDVTDANDF